MDAPGEVVATWKTIGDDVVEVYRFRPRRALSRRVGYAWRRLSGGDAVSRSADPYSEFSDCRAEALRLNPPQDPRSWTSRR